MSINKFRTFLTKIIETNGVETFHWPDDVAYLSRHMESPDLEDLEMIKDMADANVYGAFLDKQEGAYERSVRLLNNHEETEVRAYLDALKDVLDHSDPDAETENDRMLKKAEDYANGNGVCQDYEKAAKLIGKTTMWKSPRGMFIALMAAIKGEEFDLGALLDGEPVKSRISPERYMKYKEYVPWVECEEDAFDILTDCAERGVPEAQYLLGRCFHVKNSDSFVRDYMEQDIRESEEWIARAKENGFTEEPSPSADVDLAINGENPDLKLLSRLAEEGYAEAQITYAETFPAESGERMAWMKKASGQGNGTATRKVALLYRDVNHDHKNWMAWLDQAVKEDDVEAQYLLGCEYLRKENEDGAKNPDYDFAKGEKLIKKAAWNNNYDAMSLDWQIQMEKLGDDEITL